MKHKTQNQPKPEIVRTRHYNCACVRVISSSTNLPCYRP